MQLKAIHKFVTCTLAISGTGLGCQNHAADPAATVRNEAQQRARTAFNIPIDFNPVEYRRSIEREYAGHIMSRFGDEHDTNNENGFNPHTCFRQDSSQSNSASQQGLTPEGVIMQAEPMCQYNAFSYYTGDVYRDASGRVVLCRNGHTEPIAQSRYMRDIVLKAGATNDEVAGVEFYYVPYPTCNAYADYEENQTPMIVLYEGLVGGTSECSLRTHKDGMLAGILLHELGHIKQFRSRDLSGISATGNRSDEYCDDLAKNAVKNVRNTQTCGAVEQIILDAAAKCLRNQSYWSRRFEFDADNNVLVTMARNKNNPAFNPAAFADGWRTLARELSDPYSTHPEPAERAAALQVTFERLGLHAIADDNTWTRAFLPFGSP